MIQEEPWPKHSGLPRTDVSLKPNLILWLTLLVLGQSATESRAGPNMGFQLNTHKPQQSFSSS